jgi:hypothetical protein
VLNPPPFVLYVPAFTIHFGKPFTVKPFTSPEKISISKKKAGLLDAVI